MLKEAADPYRTANQLHAAKAEPPRAVKCCASQRCCIWAILAGQRFRQAAFCFPKLADPGPESSPVQEKVYPEHLRTSARVTNGLQEPCLCR